MLYLEHRPDPPLSRFVHVLWYARSPQLDHRVHLLRDALREASSPQQKLQTLENFLLINFRQHMGHRRFSVHPAVEFALRRFGQAPAAATVSGMAKDTGWSERRFSQVFREQVGFGPKAWCRIQRFQRAMRQMQACLEIPWAELAVECGFYDQAHLANEFRAFSGIDASTYTVMRDRLWQNYVRAD